MKDKKKGQCLGKDWKARDNQTIKPGNKRGIGESRSSVVSYGADDNAALRLRVRNKNRQR